MTKMNLKAIAKQFRNRGKKVKAPVNKVETNKKWFGCGSSLKSDISIEGWTKAERSKHAMMKHDRGNIKNIVAALAHDVNSWCC